MFRLLVPSVNPASPEAPCVEIGGIAWTLAEYDRLPQPAEIPAYTCISYSWGRGITANPFDKTQTISDRAIPALEATISSLRPASIWIDSICIPSLEPARADCFRRMGAIFGSAVQVSIVLSAECRPVLEQIHLTGRMDPGSLPILESDDWVTRAWTYQENANSRSASFTAAGSGPIAVDGQQMLNSLGHAITDYKKAHGLGSAEVRARFPNVDSLEDQLADYMISGYLHRFAYQVMAAMDRRHSERSDDAFNAMIGAITLTPADSADDPSLAPAERFMRLCEAKGDYSFIYSAAPRSEVPGQSWRPLVGNLPTLFPWHTFGDGQGGVQYPGYVQLNDMCRMVQGSLNSDARKLAIWWLQTDDSSATSADLAAALLLRLQRLGFSGYGEPIETEGGYFFPQHLLLGIKDFDVLVAAGVRWAHGGPGLLVSRGESSTRQFLDVGIFVGRVPKLGDSINLA